MVVVPGPPSLFVVEVGNDTDSTALATEPFRIEIGVGVQKEPVDGYLRFFQRGHYLLEMYLYVIEVVVVPGDRFRHGQGNPVGDEVPLSRA